MNLQNSAGSLTDAFNQVRWDRHRSSEHLAAELGVIGPPNLLNRIVDVQDERMAHVPNVQLPVIAHAPTMAKASTKAPSNFAGCTQLLD